METFLIISSVWILSSSVSGSDISSSKWYRETSLDNKCSLSGLGLTSRGLIHCADACAKSNTCLSFFFIKGQPENCIIHSTILLAGQPGLTNVLESAYYIMENALTTTTTPMTTTTSTTTTVPTTTSTTTAVPTTTSTTTTVPTTTSTTTAVPTTTSTTTTVPTTTSTTTTVPTTTSTTTAVPTTTSTTTAVPTTTSTTAAPTTTSTTTTVPTTTTSTATTTTTTVTYPAFSCPADDTVFRTVKLSDNSHWTYRVFKTSVNHTVATASCISEGGFLVRVATIAKMNATLALTSCSGYSTNDYYVDGSNIQSSPAWDTWILSNNITISMSNDFWGVGKPSSPASEHCIRMDNTIGHKWNDILCSNNCFYICEK